MHSWFFIQPLIDPALFLARFMVGFFLVLYRFRWFYDPSQPDPWFSQYRKNKLKERLCSCNYPANSCMCFIVASAEILGALALITGFLTFVASAGLFVILTFATKCTAWENTIVQNPVDRIDVLSCYLRTIEPLYLSMLAIIILAGPGKWSLDHWIISYVY